MYPKKQLAQLVISACQYYNIDTVVVSPGSRNAPLTIGFANAPEVDVVSIVDERCAAFFALGVAQQTKKPVVLVCTSGSALLNYYPAVAEAFYSKIPLIVISADRPKHLIDVGDGQTIRQENVFKNHILKSSNLTEGEAFITSNSELIAEAFITSITKRGPVHINVPFDEPLYETVEKLNTAYFNNSLSNGVEERIEEDVLSFPAPKKQTDFSKLSNIWNTTKRKLIVVGVHEVSEKLESVLKLLSKDPSVLIMTETTSNVSDERFINSIDKLITKLDDEAFKELQPEVLVTFGGMIISKRIKQFLRKYKPQQHWHVDEFTAMDTYFCLSEFVQEQPEVFLEKLLEEIQPVESSYQAYWLEEKNARSIQHKKFFKVIPYSDLVVCGTVLQFMPNNSCLQVSNSSVIRYVQLFNVNPTISVFCNRGTSGIDGSTSTAIGAAFANKQQTILITGDLSFFYDSNALWNAHIPSTFRIILMNNSGGGIFKIIPGPKSTNALSFFETPHNLTAEHLAKMYGFAYTTASNIKELEEGLADFYEDNNQPKILEVFTPTNTNDTILKEYFKNL
ncbi:2-succinyl-5-enolpyruvyl-6-hydroxy-3-cyclohexene-1-carboxylic-acid synthase [Tenacibaculum amylolyticum]|uniref:2-succinyl-5-enolpyruvyl-6-hydroxy-3- cyclohexene-1-carboxylic-acid synthase n=1 Tax=Tenacibaculum amylolyticum TaxID=104269 RepID=UPI0038950958